MNFSSPTIDTKSSTLFRALDNTHYTAVAFISACLVPCLPAGSALRQGLLVLQVSAAIYVFFAPPPSDVSNTAVIYTADVLGVNLLARYVDRLYLHSPEQTFSRLKYPSSGWGPVQLVRRTAASQQGEEDVNKLSGIQKFLWTFEILTVTRGIGWNWRVTSIPAQPMQLSRAQFLRSCVVKYVAMYAGLYLMGVSCSSVLDSFNSIRNSHLRASLISLTENAFFLYPFIVLGWAITIYSHFALLMLPLAIICVGLKVGPRFWREVDAWPLNYGSFKNAYSIRRFWGYTWHQQMRRTTSAPSVYLVGNRGVGNLRLIGLVGLGPASRVFTCSLLDRLLQLKGQLDWRLSASEGGCSR